MRRVGYDCDAFNKMCVAQPGGQGTYGTLGDCQADCGPKCFVPEMTGPFITEDGFWHPGRPVHGSPCSKKLVPWENLREDPSNPYHLPCMSRGECETAFNPVDVPMAGMGASAMGASAMGASHPCVPTGGTCGTDKKSCQCKCCGDDTCTSSADGSHGICVKSLDVAAAANPCPDNGEYRNLTYKNGKCYSGDQHVCYVCETLQDVALEQPCSVLPASSLGGTCSEATTFPSWNTFLECKKGCSF